MPDYNLGTARARIRVDADTRGAKLADRALDALERTIRSVSGRMSGFERTMNRMESELKDAAREFQQAERQADNFDREVGNLERTIRGARGSTREWSTDIHELHQRLRGAHQAAETLLPPFLQLARIGNQFRQTNGGWFNFIRSVHSAGGTASIITHLASSFIGLGSALSTVTGHRRRLLQLASTFQLFTFAAGIMGTLAARTGLAERAFRSLADRSEGLGIIIDRSKDRVNNFINSLDRIGIGTVQLIGGFALMQNGLNSLIGRFGFLARLFQRYPGIFAAVVAGLGVIPAALEAGAKALVFFSNFLLGALDAVKQLAGGLLVIPGAIAMGVAAFGTLRVIGEGLKSLFGDIFKAETAEEMAEAIAKLPPEFRGLGEAIANAVNKFKELQTANVRTFTQGAEQQVRALTDSYIPALEKGSLQVANSWRIAKDQIVAFAGQAQTVSDVQLIFMRTAQVINTLAPALQPALEGIRDIAVVGTEFIRNFAAGIPNLVEQFAEWARLNRENGNILRWINDAWRGIRDLATGFKDAFEAAWTLLTLFADRSPEDALARFADAMERFNDAVQKSAATGMLRDIGDAVRGMGTEKLEQLWDILRSLFDVLKQVIPFIKDFSESFGNVAVPAIKLALEVLEQFIAFVNELGGGKVLGYILGLVAAWKTLGIVLGPIRNIIQIIIGAFTGFKGAQNIVLGLMGTLENFGPLGKRASDAIGSVGDSLAKWGTFAAGAAAGIALFWAGFEQGASDIREADQALADSAEHVKEFKTNLRDAFIADRGMVGKTVFDQVKNSLDTMMTDLETQAATMPGMAATFNDQIGNLFESGKSISEQWNQLWGKSDRLEGLEQAAEDAEKAKGAFERLGIGNENLAAIVSGSQSQFHDFVGVLRASGDGGEEAATRLNQMHDAFTRLQVDFEAAGPGGAKLAEGIDLIAQAGGDATTKLEGLKLALEGLGLLKTSQYEAAFAYSEAVRGLGEAAANAADDALGFNDIIDAQGNLIVGVNGNAANLFNILTPIAEKFLALASRGGDVNQMWTDMQPQLDQVASEFGLMPDQIRNLVGQLGAMPDVVSVLIQLEGKDVLTQDLAAIVLFAQQNIGKGINVPILVQDPKAVETEIESVLGDIAYITENAIRFKFNVDPGALEVVKRILADNGIQMPGGPPVPPSEIPVAPKEPSRGPDERPSVGPSPEDQTALDTANQTIKNLKDQIKQLNENPPKVEVDTASLDTLKEAKDVVDQVKDAVTKLIEEVGKLSGKFNEQLTLAQTRLNEFGSTTRAAGEKAMQDFAAGIEAGVKAFVIPAIENGLGELNLRIQLSSPAKKGPLSGRGWPGYSGRKLAEDFAQGIISGVQGVVGAADALAGAVNLQGPTGAGQGFEKTGEFLGELSRLVSFASKFVSVLQQISDTVFTALKLISDPLGEGTFFGTKRFQKMSPEKLAQKEKQRQDQLQSRLSSAVETGTREGIALGFGGGAAGVLQGVTNPTPEQNAAAIIAEAQKRGYGRDVTIGALAAADLESNLDEAVENATGHKGLFQMDKAKYGRDSALGQIGWFFDQLDSLGGPGGITDPLAVIANQIEKGGYGPERLSEFTGQAATYFDQFASQLQDNTSALDSNTSGLKVTGRAGLVPAAENLVQIIADQFPEVTDIGGVRADEKPFHPSGRALDIMIGKNLELGDRINNFLRQNANALGIESTIWRDTWRDLEGNSSSVAGHMDHIHAQTLATADAFNNSLIGVDALTHGRGGRGLGPDLSQFTPEELKEIENNTAFSAQTQEQMLSSLRQQNTQLDQAILTGQAPNATDEQIANSLSVIQSQINSANKNDTPAGRAQVSALEDVKGSIMEQGGFEEAPNPVDIAANMVSGAFNVTQAIFGVIQTGIESVGAAKNIADTLVRGVANTEDVMNIIDSVQKFIELAARIAQAVSDVASSIGAIIGAAESAAGVGGGGAAAAQGVAAIAGIVSAVLQTTNAIIDLAQEAYRIVGSYVGQFLGFLAGGAGGKLEGNVRYLLDQTTGKLLAYSQDNPMDKRSHTVPGMMQSPTYTQGIGQINVYGGPGADPRDLTRDMMFQVKVAGMAGAITQ